MIYISKGNNIIFIWDDVKVYVIYPDWVGFDCLFYVWTYVASGMIRTKFCSYNFINQELLYLKVNEQTR